MTTSSPSQRISYYHVYFLLDRGSKAPLPVLESNCTDDLKWHWGSSDRLLIDHFSPIKARFHSNPRVCWQFLSWYQPLVHMSYDLGCIRRQVIESLLLQAALAGRSHHDFVVLSYNTFLLVGLMFWGGEVGSTVLSGVGWGGAVRLI